VTNNSLTGSPGITLQGGGLFTTLPVTLHNSVISGNIPDQCFGCTGGMANAVPSRTSKTPERGQEGLGAIWSGR